MAGLELPESSEHFREASWEDLRPFYEELAKRPLDGEAAAAWLEDWSRLTDLIAEAYALTVFDYTCNTADPRLEAANLRFGVEIAPRVQEQEVRLAARLLDAGFARPGLETMLERFRNQRELFREENVPLFATLEHLSSDYQRLTGTMTARWEDEEVPVPRILPHLEVQDREVRERAFSALYRPYVERRDEMASIFDRMLAARQQVARNAGYESYLDFGHREKNRFDYSPRDCVRWQDAVERSVVPVVARLRERRRERLGVSTLRPWDLTCDPDGLDPLRPFTAGEELIEGAARIFERLDPELGSQFRVMSSERLLDVDSRPGKAPGGYQNELAVRRRPIIFMNASGIQRDVETLLHESGHSFHAFATFDIEPSFQRFPGSEMAELASMSMELLAAPLLGRSEGGYYSDADARRARRAHLEGVLTVLPHIASVDAFQHWLYKEEAAADRDERDRAWLTIRERFDPAVDWSGLEAERVARWYYQHHFFTHPLYYIEYGLAQFAALQVWRNALGDPAGALRAYREALALGATRPLPELYGTAGAHLLFDPELMAELMDLTMREMDALEA